MDSLPVRKAGSEPNGESGGGGFSPYPIEVTVGGATLFVLSVDQFMKV